jgi:hypothetical protein
MVLNGAAEIESEGKISILKGIFEEHPRLVLWIIERIDVDKLSDECVISVTVVGRPNPEDLYVVTNKITNLRGYLPDSVSITVEKMVIFSFRERHCILSGKL